MILNLRQMQTYTKYSYTEDTPMDEKTAASLAYLEFNLIAMVNSMQPFIKDDVDMQLVYAEANKVLKEMRESLSNPTGMATKNLS